MKNPDSKLDVLDIGALEDDLRTIDFAAVVRASYETMLNDAELDDDGTYPGQHVVEATSATLADADPEEADVGEVLYSVAEDLTSKGDLEGARMVFLAILQFEKNTNSLSGYAVEKLANIYLQMGNMQQARYYFELASALYKEAFIKTSDSNAQTRFQSNIDDCRSAVKELQKGIDN